ncbi:Histidine kinase domain-containing protein [Brevibacillus sp. IT-7CA2]|uniref:ATP-binding protein n=1 Tax=Brevibacillus sp. IT-7CA2 TaxID=3026436 RepID=UPI0039DF5E17
MYFSINSRVLEHLGKDLITSDEIAISELVKNAYDAGAKQVNLHLIDNVYGCNFQNHIAPVSPEMLSIIKESLCNDGRIIIMEDNGEGMTYEELEKGFFTIGTDVKKKQKSAREAVGERLPLGEKGIGRLAAQRLSKILFIETTSINSQTTNIVRINWEDFIGKSAKLEHIELVDYELPKISEKFTRLWFIDLNVDFDSLVNDKRLSQISIFEDEEDILEPLTVKENLQSSLSFLLSPFDNELEDFNIEIYLNEEKVNSQFKNEAIKVAETEHSFFLRDVDGKLQLELSMSLNPWYLERIHRLLVDKDLFNDWRKTPNEYKQLLEKYHDKYKKSLCAKLNQSEIAKEFKDVLLKPLQDIAPLEGKVFSFKRESRLSKMAIDAAKEIGHLKRDYNAKSVPKFLEANNGIKLYRGNFRIATLGDKDSDWLQLQQARTKGQQFFRFELGNVIGYIKINDPYQDFIKETSSRLNLADNQHSKSLFSFLQSVFYHQFYEFSRSAYYISRDILNDEGMVPTNSLDKLKEKVEDADKTTRSTKQHLEEFQSMLARVQTIIETDSNSKIQEAKQVLTSLSATGVVFKETLESTLAQLQESKELVKHVENEKKLIALESYNNYKLMANGLVTEVLTHELHSILTNIKSKEHDEAHFRAIEEYILGFNRYELISEHLDPIRDQTIFLNERVRELGHFYTFMEKTFLYNGNLDDFEEEDLNDFLRRLEQRLENRLKKTAVSIDYSTVDMRWLVPRGVLIHIFYNLIDNSLYWIKERRQKQKHDKSYQRSEKDSIRLEKKDEQAIYYSDTGTGVITRMENTLFQPLQSGKERKGRGMGLYIVRQLLQSFGGDIELLPDRNEYGNRYIFAIYLNAEEKYHGVDGGNGD